ncbi:hypothetical protein Cni_G28557 [Canna indica]|uniref:Uncharacterized protein n=1 Tax=Canna indica TaxID=4628 RepID=A0AAQ3QT80_9LILI|nr:hypothetical protein Cni_G28557 [Canna indica]
MGSEVALVGELPLLPPIKTEPPPIRDEPAEGHLPTADEECVTPKSEEHVLKPVLVCPPAPRKPRLTRRSPAAAAAAPPAKEFFAVPRDLTAVFLPLPPKKRIRVV